MTRSPLTALSLTTTAWGWGWTRTSWEPQTLATALLRPKDKAWSLRVASEATKPAGHHSTRAPRDRAPGLHSGPQFVLFPFITTLYRIQRRAGHPRALHCLRHQVVPAPEGARPPHLVSVICLVSILTSAWGFRESRGWCKVRESHLWGPGGDRVEDSCHWGDAPSPHIGRHLGSGKSLGNEPRTGSVLGGLD